MFKKLSELLVSKLPNEALSKLSSATFVTFILTVITVLGIILNFVIYGKLSSIVDRV